MCYLRHLWRVWRLKRTKKRLESTRLKSLSPQPPRTQSRIREYVSKQLHGLVPLWWRRYLKRRRSESVLYGRQRKSPVVQRILKLLLLFWSGLVIAAAVHLFAVHFLFVDHTTSVAICSCLAAFLSFGLALSTRVRCVILLSAPQVFTGKGQTLLLAYMLVVANNMILSNTVKNVEAFINSSICLQNNIVDLLPPPIAQQLKVAQFLNGSGNAFEQRKASLKDSWTKLKTVFKSMDTLYNETWIEIQHKYKWLQDKQSFCRKCKSILMVYVDEVITRLYDHWAVLSLAHWLPHLLRKSAKNIIDEGFEVICDLDDDDNDLFSLRNVFGIRINRIKKYLKQQLQLDVTFNHSFVYDVKSSKSAKEVKRAVWDDVKRSFDIPLRIINLANLLLNVFTLLLFIKSIIYYERFSRSVHYDNYYISKELRLLDSRRGFLALPTVLPLTWRERRRYVTTCSLTMVGKEKKKLITSMIIIAASACHVAYYMLLDYTVHWIAKYLSTFQGLIIKIEDPLIPKLSVEGQGMGSLFVKGIVDIFHPFFNYTIPTVDLTPCLPQTMEPDYDTYVKIAGFLIGCVFMALIGAWGLRVRHLIAAHYNPQMELIRAIWLHRKIISERALKAVIKRRRGKKRWMLKNWMKLFPIILEYLTSRFPLIQKLLKKFGYRRQFCCNCGEGGDVDIDYKRCQNGGCDGIYCLNCLDILNNECVICGRQIDYHLMNEKDFSEERDSSEEELY